MRGGNRGRGRRSRGNGVAVNQNNIRSLNSGKIPFDVVFFDEGSRAEPGPDDSALTAVSISAHNFLNSLWCDVNYLTLLIA